MEIKNIPTSDPNQFWKAIKLGTKKERKRYSTGSIQWRWSYWDWWNMERYTFLSEPGTFNDNFFDEHQEKNTLSICDNPWCLQIPTF